MPKLKPDTQRARREHILDAAEICFASNGFHRTTMHDICRQAGVSPGARCRPVLRLRLGFGGQV